MCNLLSCLLMIMVILCICSVSLQFWLTVYHRFKSHYWGGSLMETKCWHQNTYTWWLCNYFTSCRDFFYTSSLAKLENWSVKCGGADQAEVLYNSFFNKLFVVLPRKHEVGVPAVGCQLMRDAAHECVNVEICPTRCLFLLSEISSTLLKFRLTFISLFCRKSEAFWS